MSNWAIVAIPDENDYTWRLSSEKVPHITLLFLGDQTNNPNEVRVASFVEHVAEGMHSFGLQVDKRGVLGPKDAEVLFFKQNRYLKDLADARASLLGNPVIKAAYLSTEQYPDWQPHLTMGFPETPAKPDDRDYPGLQWVGFSKLALWTEDYAGYVFDLDDKNYGDDLAMSDNTANFLAHHGVKGMRWGRHLPGKDRVSVNAKADARTEASPDAVKARTLGKTAKRSGTAALSNSELQTLVTRQNLEQQYSRLNPGTVKKGNAHIKEILAIAGTVTAGYALYESPIGKLARGAINSKIKK